MIGAIAGDIIGSRFEGKPGPPPNFELFHPDCRFTDDTVCTLAVADALMGARDIAAQLRGFCRRHPHRGYGGMFRRWFRSDDALAYGSWGNGAPMRVSSVGWLAGTHAEVLALAEAQAIVTHDHPDAIAAAQAVALAIWLLRRGEDAVNVRVRIEQAFDYDLEPERALDVDRVRVHARATAIPVLAAALSAADWEAAVRQVIALGGDADTSASIAGAVAEARFGVPAMVAETARAFLTTDLSETLAHFERHLGQA
jgi:ADP-ribosylglycohydrolase